MDDGICRHRGRRPQRLIRRWRAAGGYVSRVTDTGSEFKANVSAVFLAENVFRVFLYTMLGMITVDVLKTALLLMPAMLAGLFAGIAVSRKIDDKAIKKLVLLLLMFSGIVLILQNIG